MSSVPSVSLSSTFVRDIVPPNLLVLVGPILIGNLVGWLLLGVLTMQLYVYHVCFPNDHQWIKLTAYGLFLLELVQTVCTTSAAWSALCAGWGDPTALTHTGWGFALTPVASGSISGWVHIFFAWRVWVLGRSPFWTALTALIVAVALTQAGAAMAISIKFVHINNVRRLHEVDNLVPVWLAGSAIADVLIAFSMVYFLISARRKPKWSGRADKRTTKLIRCTVETGVLSAAVASLDLGLYMGFKHNNLHVAVATMLSKLYSNALMASLNSRAGVYERNPPSSSRWNNDTVQFTSVGIAVTVDDSASTSGTVTSVVHDAISEEGSMKTGQHVQASR